MVLLSHCDISSQIVLQTKKQLRFRAIYLKLLDIKKKSRSVHGHGDGAGAGQERGGGPGGQNGRQDHPGLPRQPVLIFAIIKVKENVRDSYTEIKKRQ